MASSAINALIKEYFVQHYPAVAKAFKKDSALIDEAKREHLFKQSNLEVLICNSNPKRKRDNSVSSNSGSLHRGLKEAPSKVPHVESKKAPMLDSSDSEASVSIKAPKGVSRNVSETDRKSVSNTQRQMTNNNQAHSVPLKGTEDGSYRRFQRIDPTKVEFHAEVLRDNRPGSEHMVLKQNQEMMRVKGKNFNKLKQKNKGKFYGVGVDFSVRSYQFPDSDED
ncbi:unnamed protein product [Phytomonas sp. Hart1]|nr:unnamed protein product [Phytomonas sp. Hart1]|eukprot:CCW71415.1 unnamed protein product [Phytomonas sp. isolate Hart1]